MMLQHLVTCAAEYVVTRTWTAVDGCGNTSNRVQTIAVVDSTPPVITCPADLTLECTEGTSPDDTGMATGTDICDSEVTITLF